jgi:hypothetical protein
MTHLRFLFLVFVLVCAGSFLACSKSTPATSPGTAEGAAAQATPVASTALPQPCTLLAAKDFEEAFGPGAQMTPNIDNSCSIEGPKGALQGMVGVSIQPLDAARWDRTKQAILANMPKEKSVSGIGEDAYTMMDSIVFRQGKANVTVTVGAYTGRKPKAEVARHIAELVAARLSGAQPIPAQAGPAAQGNPTLASWITVADVEKVGGLTGITQSMLGDRVRFNTQGNLPVLEVELHSHFGDRLFKQTKATSMNVHASVSGIGDDAFDGPSDAINMGVSGPDGKKQPYLLWFLKGSTSVRLTTFASSSHPQFYLSQEKLRELAKIMVSRM